MVDKNGIFILWIWRTYGFPPQNPLFLPRESSVENISLDLVAFGLGILAALSFSWESLAGTRHVPSPSTFTLSFAFFRV